MSVLGRLLVSSAERLDLPDLLSIDSYAAGDWKYFIQGLVGPSKPYILKGFDVIDPQNAIGTQACSIRVADSIVMYPGSNSGPFYHGLSEGNENAQPLVPELRKNAVNYVYLTFSTFNTSVDTRAFWDPDKDGGAGGEFTQDVNTESVLKVEVNVSTGSFPANTIPVCKVTVGAVVITAIEDARDMMFRLGTGGISPNPNATYNFRSLPSAGYQREEPPTVMTNPSDPNPFQGADKNILSLKEWMDVVMTKLKELGGTNFWYEDASTFSVIGLFADALATTYKSKGKYEHSSATAGELTWTEDVQIKRVNSPEDIIIRAGTIEVDNEQVAYIPLVRSQQINTFDEVVSWTNGQPYVNTVGGSIGKFANLEKGDWIRKISDDVQLLARVEEFYDAVNLGGSVTTAANARSIRLDRNYAGSTAQERGRFDRGVYTSADIVISDRSAPAIGTAGGNFHWFAMRSDTIQNVGTIQSFTLTGTVDSADGEIAQITVTAHGLVDGDRIIVSAPAAQAGTYSVEVEDVDTFIIRTTNTTTGAFSANYGLLTTAARNNGYGLQLESADHGFESGETIQVAGTTNFDGPYVVNYRSPTQVQFPIDATFAQETAGTASLARIDVRTEAGITKVVQGEIIDIGEGDSDNIQSYIGMGSLSQTHPDYFVPLNYGTLWGMANYNSLDTDNLTTRTSKLTAMMADRVQDRDSILLGRTTIRNVSSGANQVITASATLRLEKPASAPQTVNLGCTLPINSVAVMTVNRNAATAINLTIKPIAAAYVLAENDMVVFYRLTDTTVHTWTGAQILTNGAYTTNNPEESQNKNILIDNPGRVDLNVSSGLVTFVDSPTADINIIVPGAPSDNTMDISALNTLGTFIMADGYSAWVRIDRVNNKTFDQIATSDSPEVGSGVVYITPIADVPVDQDVVVVFTRLDNKLIQSKSGTPPAQNIYDEILTIVAGAPADDNEMTGPVTFGDNIVLPLDSREGNAVREYVVGAGMLQVYLNGQELIEGQDWLPLGSSGSLSSTIIILQDLPVGDRFDFRIDSQGGVWIASGGGGGGGVPGGSNTQIQYNTLGTFGGDPDFTWNSTTNTLGIGQQKKIALDFTALNDNQAIPATALSFTASTARFAIIDYSIERDTTFEVGQMMVSNNGTLVGFNTTSVTTAPTGVVFTAAIVGLNLVISYTSTNTGFPATLKYSIKYWS